MDRSVAPDVAAPVAGAVVASGFRPLHPDEAPFAGRPDPLLDVVEAAVAAWADGDDSAALGSVPVSVPEAGFRGAVWRALRDVPAGSVVSYGDLAGLAGNPRAARAAGSACAANPVAPFIPCHRVIRSTGDPGRYGYGASVKQALLAHEGAQRRAAV